MTILQIIGKGGFARELVSYIQRFDTLGIKTDIRMFENEEIKNANPDIATVIAIGDPEIRKKITAEMNDFNYIHLNHGISFGINTLGEGSIICPGTLITTNIQLGKHVIINLNCSVGHDSTIGDFTTISPGVNISGKVKIGNECYIGTNAVIREGIDIVSGVTIGAGGVVVKNIMEPGVYVGNPVKKIK